MIGSNEARRWRVDTSARDNPDAVRALEDKLGLYRLTASLLYSRGYRTPEAATAFLRRDDECFHDPLLLPDMDKAVERVTAAINSGERVMIYGDCDVDGVTSVATLFLYLRSKGVPVDYYIPERTSEGYGMNEGAVRRIAAGGTSLIITVDTGITAVEETALASSLGVDTVVTDHHECHGELPQAIAAVNPHRPDSEYPFAELAGVGVAFKLICAVEQLLVPDADRYLQFISKNRDGKNILSWLGDAAHLYRWQEYYNALTVQMARAFGCRLVDLRTAFLQSRNFLDLLCPDGIHPTDSGYALAHKTLSAAMY